VQARARDSIGVSLVGLLVIVVVLGGLAATAIVGVNTLTATDSTTVGTTPETARSDIAHRPGELGAAAGATAGACHASAAAATAASAAYFATTGGSYPAEWSDLTDSSPPMFSLPAHVVVNARDRKELDGVGWQLHMSGDGTAEPAFGCTFPRS
jgi:hypothetical protein